MATFDNLCQITHPLSAVLARRGAVLDEQLNARKPSRKSSATSRIPMLAFPQLNAPFILDSDVGDSGLGAVLFRVQCEKERAIAYAARALSKAGRNYSSTRKELLAFEWGTELSERFLCGRRFLVRTDHSALQRVRNLKNLEARWLGGLKGLVTLLSR